MDLTERNAIITGGASGIGAATAREFARLGARVVVADKNGDGARRVADEIGGVAVACDVGNEVDVNALVGEAERANGPVEVFFSNAGIATGGSPLDTDIDTWNEQWQVNVMAHVFAVRAVLPSMLERESGYLLHTASIAGILTSHGNLTYAVTKHAVVGARRVVVDHLPQQGHPRVLAGPARGTYADAGVFLFSFRQQRGRPHQGTGRGGPDGVRRGLRGTFPDPHRSHRRDLDGAQDQRPGTLAERYAADAGEDRGRAVGATPGRPQRARRARGRPPRSGTPHGMSLRSPATTVVDQPGSPQHDTA